MDNRDHELLTELSKDMKLGFEKQNDQLMSISEKIGGKVGWGLLIPLVIFLTSVILTFHYSDVKQIRREIRTAQAYEAPEHHFIDDYTEAD